MEVPLSTILWSDSGEQYPTKIGIDAGGLGENTAAAEAIGTCLCTNVIRMFSTE